MSSTLTAVDDDDLRVPAPSHRHAAPSGPWPWMDFGSDFVLFRPVDGSEPQSSDEGNDPNSSWEGYPQSLYPNWLPDQVERCKMKLIPPTSGISKIHSIDVFDESGLFKNTGSRTVLQGQEKDYWNELHEDRPDGIRVRALFVHRMTVPVLQMLGTTYNIEPFFFSSSLNWIPSRYQEQVVADDGDHITITLPFIRTMKNPITRPSSPMEGYSHVSPEASTLFDEEEQIIDTQAPLSLTSNKSILLRDLLAIHMLRSAETSTIISYHPEPKWRTTDAGRLHSVVMAASRSVYWTKNFRKSNDPTFVLLAILWYPLYAWDETLEVLYEHITTLESRVIKTNDMRLVQELHKIQAHLLHYAGLLEDFKKSVTFVLQTRHPVMGNESDGRIPQKWQASRDLMRKECNNLLSEIDRLERSRIMQIRRLKNVMNLAFATVNIEDSRDMRRLTEAAVRDSAAMRQISYLTMFFLPASFAAGVFGMNVKEIVPDTEGSIAHYVALTLSLTAATVWVVVAFQSKSFFHGKRRAQGDGKVTELPMWLRLLWPFTFAKWMLLESWPRNKRRSAKGLPYWSRKAP